MSTINVNLTSKNGTTLATAGKYCDRNVVVTPVLESKTVAPSTSQQVVTPSSGKAGLEQVTVQAVPTAAQAKPVISISSAGLITASATQQAGYVVAGTESTTHQLTTQAAKTITPGTSDQTAVAKDVYTTGIVKVAGDADLISGNIKAGITIFGVSGATNVVDTTVSSNASSANNTIEGKIGFANGKQFTGNIPNNSSMNFTPTAADQTIPKGYYNGSKILGDANLVASNIKKGIEIFGVTGTHECSKKSISAGGNLVRTYSTQINIPATSYNTTFKDYYQVTFPTGITGEVRLTITFNVQSTSITYKIHNGTGTDLVSSTSVASGTSIAKTHDIAIQEGGKVVIACNNPSSSGSSAYISKITVGINGSSICGGGLVTT